MTQLTRVLLVLTMINAHCWATPIPTIIQLPAIDEDSIRIVRIGDAIPENHSGLAIFQPTGQSAPSLAGLVNLGEKAWSLISNNRPIVKVGDSPAATALPKGISHWKEMSGWSPTNGSLYELSAKNALGITVIKLRYLVKRSYGGHYKGKGRYLTNVSIEPMLVDVAWGYHFSVEVHVPETGIINVGTSENPLAAMSIQMKWAMSTPVRDTRGQSIYYLQGDGLLQELGGRFRGSEMPAIAPNLSKG